MVVEHNQTTYIVREHLGGGFFDAATVADRDDLRAAGRQTPEKLAESDIVYPFISVVILVGRPYPSGIRSIDPSNDLLGLESARTAFFFPQSAQSIGLIHRKESSDTTSTGVDCRVELKMWAI